MNKFTKVFACAVIAASILLFACDINRDDESSSSSSIAQSSSSFENKDTLPVMDSRVVSYQRTQLGHEYREQLGYGYGFTNNEHILKLWFPNVFNDTQTESKCNYFAIYFSPSSNFYSYKILSQNMILYSVHANFEGKNCAISGDFIYEVMLVCDDEVETLRKSINIDSIVDYIDENWDCETGEGRPNPEDVFF